MRWAVLAVCLLPSVALVVHSGADVSLDARQRDILWRTTWMSAVATTLSLVWGILAATAARRRPLFEALSVVPLILPPIVTTMGWVYFLDIQSTLGAAFVLSLCYYPIVALMTLQGWRSMNPGWAAAARMEAGPWRSFWHVKRPLMTPYWSAASLIVFLLCFADYSVPSALRVNVYAFEIFSEFSSSHLNSRAVSLCLAPVGIAIALSLIRRRVILHETIGYASRLDDSRTPAWPGALFLALTLAIPLGMLAATVRPDTVREAYTAVRDNFVNSIFLSTCGAGAVLLGAGVISLRRPGPWFESVLLLPLVIPGAAVGLGIVILYVHHALPLWFYSGAPVMIYALFCRTITIPALILCAASGSIRRRLLDAADVPPLKRWWGIQLPLMAPGIAAAAIAGFVFCLGELSATAVVNAAGQETLTMRIESLLHFGEHRMIAAICLALACLCAPALWGAAFILSLRGRRLWTGP